MKSNTERSIYRIIVMIISVMFCAVHSTDVIKAKKHIGYEVDVNDVCNYIDKQIWLLQFVSMPVYDTIGNSLIRSKQMIRKIRAIQGDAGSIKDFESRYYYRNDLNNDSNKFAIGILNPISLGRNFYLISYDTTLISKLDSIVRVLDSEFIDGIPYQCGWNKIEKLSDWVITPCSNDSVSKIESDSLINERKLFDSLIESINSNIGSSRNEIELRFGKGELIDRYSSYNIFKYPLHMLYYAGSIKFGVLYDRNGNVKSIHTKLINEPISKNAGFAMNCWNPKLLKDVKYDNSYLKSIITDLKKMSKSKKAWSKVKHTEYISREF